MASNHELLKQSQSWTVPQRCPGVPAECLLKPPCAMCPRSYGSPSGTRPGRQAGYLWSGAGHHLPPALLGRRSRALSSTAEHCVPWDAGTDVTCFQELTSQQCEGRYSDGMKGIIMLTPTRLKIWGGQGELGQDRWENGGCEDGLEQQR